MLKQLKIIKQKQKTTNHNPKLASAMFLKRTILSRGSSAANLASIPYRTAAPQHYSIKQKFFTR